MDPFWIGLLGLALLLVLVFYGVNIAIALGAVGLLGLFCLVGVGPAMNMFGSIAYYNLSSLDFVVVPLFVLMGMLATSTGVSTGAYDCAAKWLGRIPGGLGVATTLGCTAFGTLNGSALVTVSVFGKASAPEMIKYGYDKKIAYGLVCAAGNIGQMIPPSLLLVYYGALSEDSIGRLLVAGVSPGLALTLAFSAYMIIMSIVRPNRVPIVNVSYTMKEKLRSLTGLIPIAITAAILLGGLLGGIFSTSEAGAIGCLVFFLYALINRVSLQKLKEAFLETLHTCGMIFSILLCAGIFAKFLTVSTFADTLVGVVQRHPFHPTVMMLIVVVIYLILGCFLDSTSILSITLPILLPVVDLLGIDRFHFAMVLLLAVHAGLLTPPMGLGCFTMKGVADKDTTLGEIFAGSMPFLIIMLIVMVIYVFVPELSTFLPNLMQ